VTFEPLLSAANVQTETQRAGLPLPPPPPPAHLPDTAHPSALPPRLTRAPRRRPPCARAAPLAPDRSRACHAPPRRRCWGPASRADCCAASRWSHCRPRASASRHLRPRQLPRPRRRAGCAGCARPARGCAARSRSRARRRRARDEGRTWQSERRGGLHSARPARVSPRARRFALGARGEWKGRERGERGGGWGSQPADPSSRAATRCDHPQRSRSSARIHSHVARFEIAAAACKSPPGRASATAPVQTGRTSLSRVNPRAGAGRAAGLLCDALMRRRLAERRQRVDSARSRDRRRVVGGHVRNVA
jgi:hypothetical protein